jgi:hypothetical protein
LMITPWGINGASINDCKCHKKLIISSKIVQYFNPWGNKNFWGMGRHQKDNAGSTYCNSINSMNSINFGSDNRVTMGHYLKTRNNINN